MSLLSDEQLELLDEKGYLILPAALDPASIDALRVALRRTSGTRRRCGRGIEVSQEAGSDRLANLVDKDPLFDRCWTYPPQLAAVSHVFASLTSSCTR